MGYAWLSHTADIALRAWGPDPPSVFVEAARGLLEEMTEGALRDVSPTAWMPVRICAPSYGELLVDWLNELIFWYETRSVYAVAFQVRIGRIADGFCLEGKVGTFPVGTQIAKLQIKAATYHGLRFVQTPDGKWEAEVVLDI